MELYQWQKDLFFKWSDCGFRGTLQAVTGAGKTVAACECIRRYRTLYPKSIVWVITDYTDLKAQWEREPMLDGVSDVHIFLYLASISEFEKLQLSGEPGLPDLLIVDECHHAEAPVWSKILRKGVKHVLGMSATPGYTENLIGPVIEKVGFDRAIVSPVTTHLITYNLSESQARTYSKHTDAMRRYQSDYNQYATFVNDAVYRTLVLKRKKFLQSTPQRFKIALDAVKRNLGRRTMVFFTTQKQLEDFSKMLNAEGISHARHHSKCREIDKFTSHSTDILLSINMVATGFSDDTVEVGIMVSYAQSHRENIQRVGRILRAKEGKHADVYYIIANGTTDDEIISSRNQLFPPGTTQVEEWKA